MTKKNRGKRILMLRFLLHQLYQDFISLNRCSSFSSTGAMRMLRLCRTVLQDSLLWVLRQDRKVPRESLSRFVPLLRLPKLLPLRLSSLFFSYCAYYMYLSFFLSSERGRFPLPFHAFYFTIFTTSSPTFTINTPWAGTDISFSPSTATALLTITPFTV